MPMRTSSLFWMGLLLGCADSRAPAPVTRDAMAEPEPEANRGDTDSATPSRDSGSASAPRDASPTPTPTPTVDADVCASVRVKANRITPEVMLVIDGSGSMAEPLGTISRWGTLRDALFGTTGVVKELEGIVRFGMTVYSTPIPMRGTPLGMCPSLLTVPSALSNLDAITAAFPQRPSGGFTPTGEALRAVVDALEPAENQGETLIVLATDGEPNSCEALARLPLQSLLDGQVPVDYASSEAAVRAARARDIDTYVVSLAPSLLANAESRGHLQELANLGLGLQATASAELFSPRDTAQLASTLRGLVGAVVSCDVRLEGELVVARACDGDVRLSGSTLPCGAADGWSVVDASTIRLQGKACETWKNQAAAEIEATFPCEALVPLL